MARESSLLNALWEPSSRLCVQIGSQARTFDEFRIITLSSSRRRTSAVTRHDVIEKMAVGFGPGNLGELRNLEPAIAAARQIPGGDPIAC
jgi:hypothetical protein